MIIYDYYDCYDCYYCYVVWIIIENNNYKFYKKGSIEARPGPDL